MKKVSLDVDGQPLAPINLNQNLCRSVDELYGLCEGVLADHVLVNEEIEFLANWLTLCHHLANEYPANEIRAKVAEILDDNEITKQEAEELQIVLAKAVGGLQTGVNRELRATRLPCDESLAPIKFQDRSFCFTGKFRFGERKECEAATVQLGGRVEKSVTRKLDYLVIGTLASRDWVHSNHGRKIEAAVRNKDQGGVTVVVSEENWTGWLSKAVF
jgi:NAD-dependent DNA ligase